MPNLQQAVDNKLDFSLLENQKIEFKPNDRSSNCDDVGNSNVKRSIFRTLDKMATLLYASESKGV